MDSAKDEQIKDKMRSYVLDHLDELFADINSLEPKERAKARMSMMEYFAPKVQAVKAAQGGSRGRSALLLDKEMKK